MAMTINTNFASMNAQRNLQSTQGSLNTSLQRLSTGLRINSAKDDSAGLQISNRMDSQISGLKVAQRNANDGISMSQTAEGSLQEYTNILQRMRDLGIQSKNGTNSTEDRASLDKEFQAMTKELDRITETTTYGKGEKLFDKLSEGVNFQVGADVDTVTVAAATAGAAGASVESLDDVEKALEQFLGDSTKVGATALEAGATLLADPITTKVLTAGAIDVLNQLGVTEDNNGKELSTTTTLSDLNMTEELESKIASFGTLATAVKTAGLDFTKGDHADNTVAKADAVVNAINAYAATGASTNQGNTIGVKVESSMLDTSKLGAITDEATAGLAVTQIDSLIENVGSIRADLGATQNRFQSTINNLGNIAENMAVAKGRIMDADIAAESANMTKQNTMMQAGITVLSQANQMPSMVSQLLR